MAKEHFKLIDRLATWAFVFGLAFSNSNYQNLQYRSLLAEENSALTAENKNQKTLEGEENTSFSSLREIIDEKDDKEIINNLESLKSISDNIVKIKSRFSENGWIFGSGVLATTDGYVITANHILEGKGELLERFIITQKDDIYQVENVIASVKESDISLIKACIPSNEPRAIKMKIAKDEPRLGEEVSVMGFTNDLFYRSLGTVSNLKPGRNIKGFGNNSYTFETDVRGKVGQSGGAVVNAGGELMGIVNYTTTQKTEDLGFIGAVRIGQAVKCIEDFLCDNKIAIEN